MTVDVELRVTGVDLDNETTGEILGKDFPDTAWEENSGLVTVTVFAEQDELVESVVGQAHQLEAALPGLKVLGVFRDLVPITAIAHRVGLSREGIRKWTMESDFPTPASVLDPGSVKVWPWSEVIDWVRDSRGVDLEDRVPSTQEATQIDNCLMQNPDSTSVQWETVRVDHQRTPFRQASHAKSVVMPTARWSAEIRSMTSVAVSASSPVAVHSC